MGSAENGSIVILGRQTGKTYVCDFYCPDATGTALTFNLNGSAVSTSQPQLVIPENGYITDVSIATGTTNVGVVLTQNNQNMVGGTLRWANQLNTLSQRPALRIPVIGGANLGGQTF